MSAQENNARIIGDFQEEVGGVSGQDLDFHYLYDTIR